MASKRSFTAGTAELRKNAVLPDQLKSRLSKSLFYVGFSSLFMIPVWSSATVGGLLLAGLKQVTPSLQNELFTRTKGSGAEVIRKKGGAGWAVDATIAETIHAVALDTKALLPVSSQQHGCYGLREISISVPTIVGRAGVIDHVELDLWPKEIQGLQASGRALRETLNKVI